ncbi:hypothetical protein N799_09840 [Lysobacter arseniciresistens ZS79]|uniref:Uncharacterized protein n=1 Tax=Lysobacter arseniciresistens ZS79 TaxID=913325 RepID=A0A0A0EUF5_9GAMM|nr:hypothetical protein [Lysobacter arseniciresistens]KGM54174.1 hypothetical protein N799_09840 [Lysobacter arseniciresistens ZS79]
MADGGRAGISTVERAARLLAASYGQGSALGCKVDQVGAVDHDTRGSTVAIAWRGHREESAARQIGEGTRARAMHRWVRSEGVAALPSFRPDRDAVAALGRVETVPGALLRVYALEQWSAWPMVESAALVVVAGKGSREAVCDAMGRILWRVAAVSQDERARLLGMRAATYRTHTRKSEALLWRWLDRGAGQLLAGMAAIKAERRRVESVQGGDPLRGGRSEPCGFRAECWWKPDGYAPVRRHE